MMGREIRRVPPGWQHPRKPDGYWQPCHDQTFADAVAEWDAGEAEWNAGRGEWRHDDAGNLRPDTWAEWHGDRPSDPAWWRPEFDAEPTCYQVYENVTEGTPWSPVFATTEDIMAWLMGQGYGEDPARRFVAEGYAPSFAMIGIGGPRPIIVDGITAAGL